MGRLWAWPASRPHAGKYPDHQGFEVGGAHQRVRATMNGLPTFTRTLFLTSFSESLGNSATSEGFEDG